ncbi:uncharacterized protein AKAME5_001149500 [Lates japonicus]|uniref:Secreted protein n=1 Tax=Lates japonicus TaxID=270547 RepID=A0AAD3MTT2_LATJO|nr:uncharacterized protein AKAME5_001149500 [Lates japonicus]
MTTEATEILLIKNMTLISVLIWTLLCCCFTESRGQVTVTQPGAVSAAVGGSVTINSARYLQSTVRRLRRHARRSASAKVNTCSDCGAAVTDTNRREQWPIRQQCCNHGVPAPDRAVANPACRLRLPGDTVLIAAPSPLHESRKPLAVPGQRAPDRVRPAIY